MAPSLQRDYPGATAPYSLQKYTSEGITSDTPPCFWTAGNVLEISPKTQILPLIFSKSDPKGYLESDRDKKAQLNLVDL